VSFWVLRGGGLSTTLFALWLRLIRPWSLGIVKLRLKCPEMSKDLLGCLSLKEMWTIALDASEHQTESVSSSEMIVVSEPTKSKTLILR
jgi:hypothetical protein